jgi:hypothetical protein
LHTPVFFFHFQKFGAISCIAAKKKFTVVFRTKSKKALARSLFFRSSQTQSALFLSDQPYGTTIYLHIILFFNTNLQQMVFLSDAWQTFPSWCVYQFEAGSRFLHGHAVPNVLKKIACVKDP